MMKKYNFVRTLTAGVVLSAAFYPQVFAVSYSETTCDDANGLQCWSCGANCKATLYDGGKLVISGSGAMSRIDGRTGPWSASNQNLIQPVYQVEFKEGITAIESTVFWQLPSIKRITLADSIRRIDDDGIDLGNTSWELIISENSSLTSMVGHFLVPRVFCGGEVQKCSQILKNANSLWSSAIITNERRDADGNLLEKCSSSGCLKYDTSGKILGGYDFHDNLVAEYNDDGKLIAKYDSDGNQTGVYKYDGAGNLTAVYENGVSTYKKTSYTPAEAAAAVKKGNNNKITFTFK